MNNKYKRSYGRQLLIAIDQFLNTVFAGYADETLSARAYRMSKDSTKLRWSIVRAFIDTLFFWEKDHCFNSYLSELARKHFPESYKEEGAHG